MYTFIQGTLLYSGTLPGLPLSGSSGSLLLDTTDLNTVLGWTSNSLFSSYIPNVPNIILGISIWKIDSTGPITRSFIDFIEYGVDFNQGDVVTLTSYTSGLSNNTDLIFVIVGGDSGGLYEIPTQVTVLSGTTGVIPVSVNNITSITGSHSYDVPLMTIVDGSQVQIGIVDDYIGLHIPYPSTNNAMIKLVRQVPDLL